MKSKEEKVMSMLINLGVKGAHILVICKLLKYFVV